MRRACIPLLVVVLCQAGAHAHPSQGARTVELDDCVERAVYYGRRPGAVEYRALVGGLGAFLGRGTRVRGYLKDDSRLFFRDESQQEPNARIRTRFLSQAYGATDADRWNNLVAHAVRLVTVRLDPSSPSFKEAPSARWSALRRRAAELVKQGPEELVLARGWISRAKDQIFKGELSVMNLRTILCDDVETQLVRQNGELVFRARPYLLESLPPSTRRRPEIGWAPWVTIATYKPGRFAKEVFLPAGLESLFSDFAPTVAQALPAAH